MAGDHAASAAAKGATYLMGLQISSRALTFVLNQILLRYLTAETLGRAVQLELYSISVLFFARESLRVAVQRVGVKQDAPSTHGAEKAASQQAHVSTTGKAVQTVINLSYLSAAIGAPLAIGLGVMCLRALRATDPTRYTSLTALASGEDPNLSAVIVYGVATIIELISEPGFAAAQTLLEFKMRAKAEATATFQKTMITVATALGGHHFNLSGGVMPFAYGQLAYSTTLIAYYTFALRPHASKHGFVLALRRINDPTYWKGYLSRPLLTLATSLSVQSGVKYILTQGDTILIAAMASLQDQGAYALAANYGGLVARMLFQPIEEASRNVFAKLCAGGDKASRARAGQILTTILHVYALVGLLAVSLGPALAPQLLGLVAGRRWTDSGAGEVLGTYTYYIPLLAVNGVAEAFVASVASNSQLYRQSVWMGGIFVAFAGSAWWFLAGLGLGAEGIVWANCINMALRIGYCLWFIGGYFAFEGVDLHWSEALPSAGSIGGSAAVPMLLKGSQGMLTAYGAAGELVRTCGVAALLVVAMAASELRFFKRCYGMVKGSSA